VVLLAAAALAAASLLPIRRYVDQGKSIDRAEQELSALQEQRERLKFLIERAQDPKIIEREARRQLLLVQPGDEIFLFVVPADIIKLPPGWHLPGVQHLVAGDS
jgi:cell division protein FtsB